MPIQLIDNIPTVAYDNDLDKLKVKASELETKLDALNVLITSIKDTGGIKKITDVVNTQLNGSNIDRRGLAANKPVANTVDVGVTYWSVDEDPHGDSIEVSDGTTWVVI